MGRPTKYNPSILVETRKYLKQIWEAGSMPTIEGLCEKLDINTDTAWEWGKKYKLFSDAIKRLMDIQRKRLIEDGMYGGREVNSTMAIFLLKANHNMIETERKMLVGKDGEKLEGLVIIKDGS